MSAVAVEKERTGEITMITNGGHNLKSMAGKKEVGKKATREASLKEGNFVVERRI